MFNSGFIPYGWSFLGDDDVAAVDHAMRQEILTTGPTVRTFEEAFAEKVGVAHAVSCNSGTSALHLAAASLDLGPGDVAIVPSMTFLATANGPRYVGADVQFADVDPDTGLLTPETLKQALAAAEGRTVKAVFVVHINGQTADIEGIRQIADQQGLYVVEDACHAIGTTYQAADRLSNEVKTYRVGECAHSDMAVFSFHPVKTITTGEGGMVTTKDAAWAHHMVCLRTHGVIRDDTRLKNPDLGFDAKGERNPWYYEMHYLGFNFRITDFQCALGLRQLAKLDIFAARRRQLMAMYDERFAELAPVVRPIARRPGVDPCLHLYPLLIDFDRIEISRAELISKLRDRKIGTQVHYIPVHCQPYYRELYGTLDLPGAMEYYNRVLSIPFYPAMQDAHVDYVFDEIKLALGL